MGPMAVSNEPDLRFARAAVRRKRIFLALAVAGVLVGVGFVAWIGYRRWADPTFPLGLRLVIVVLVLLNARQNLRQYRYAVALEGLLCNNPRERPGE
jgi:hypothetical protein